MKVNNRDALVYYISPTQINALAPADTAAGTVNVTVTNARGTSGPVAATYQRYAPGLFAFEPQNRLYAAAVHPDGTYVGPAGLFGSGLTSAPVRTGSRVLLFGTGFGATTPATDPAIQITSPVPLASPNDLRILIGGVPAVVEFAGLVSSGLYQFNVVVPNVPEGDQAVIAEIGGLRSQSTLRLRVQRVAQLPQLTSVAPAVVYPGRIYSTANLNAGTRRGEFLIRGSELSDVQRAEISPATGITLTPAKPMDLVNGIQYDPRRSNEISGWLNVDAGAAVGTRRLGVISPLGASNEITFEVRQAPVTSPVISAVSLDAPTESSSAFPAVTYRGRLTFADSDGDVNSTGSSTTGAFIRLVALTGDTGANVQVNDIPYGFSDSPNGKTSGTLSFSYTMSSTGFFLPFRSTTRVAVTLFDAAYNPSNTVIVTVPSWLSPIF